MPTNRKLTVRAVAIPTTTKPASKPGKPVSAGPIAKPATAAAVVSAALGAAAKAQANAGRSNVDKPDTSVGTVATVKKQPGSDLTRTAATIVRNATHFGGLSDRDAAYITFYAKLAKQHGGKLTLAAIVASASRPAYDGSNKPHDAGVINRLGKAGLLNRSIDGTELSFTDAAKTHAAYRAGVA